MMTRTVAIVAVLLVAAGCRNSAVEQLAETSPLARAPRLPPVRSTEKAGHDVLLFSHNGMELIRTVSARSEQLVRESAEAAKPVLKLLLKEDGLALEVSKTIKLGREVATVVVLDGKTAWRLLVAHPKLAVAAGGVSLISALTRAVLRWARGTNHAIQSGAPLPDELQEAGFEFPHENNAAASGALASSL